MDGGHATVWLVMPLAKMGRLGEEQVEKGNRNFCFDLFHFQFSSVQSLSRVRLFVTP